MGAVGFEPDTIVPNAVVGAIAIAVGWAVIVHRTRLNALVQRKQRSYFGARAQNMSSGRQTPFQMGLVGCVAIVIGLIAVGRAVVGVVQLFG